MSLSCLALYKMQTILFKFLFRPHFVNWHGRHFVEIVSILYTTGNNFIGVMKIDQLTQIY